MRKLRINKLSEEEKQKSEADRVAAAEEKRQLNNTPKASDYPVGYFFTIDEEHNILPATAFELQSAEERRVGFYEIDGFRISTVFLGINHSSTGTPKLFESAIILPSGTIHVLARYSTYNEALEAHQAVVTLIDAVKADWFECEEDVFYHIEAAFDEVR